MRNIFRAISILSAGLVFGTLTATYFLKCASGGNTEVAVDLSRHHAVMHECMSDVIQRLSPSQMSAGFYERIWRLCGNQIFNGLYLDDFLIRRQKFIQQELDERVNLWLVVAITISGVLFAGVQLVMSFKLAAGHSAEFAKDSQVTIEAGKISLRSSITVSLYLHYLWLFSWYT